MTLHHGAWRQLEVHRSLADGEFAGRIQKLTRRTGIFETCSAECRLMFLLDLSNRDASLLYELLNDLQHGFLLHASSAVG